MIINPAPQRSEAWTKARLGIPTASEFHRLISPTFQVRKGDGPHTYLCEKLAEKWTGMLLPSRGSFGALEQGTILEEEALPWYELETGQTVQRVGLVTTDDGRIGASPDGLIGDDSGIEIKCPEAQTHVGYLLAGELPEEYRIQVHGSLFVTGRARWVFVTYRRGFPNLVLTVERDPRYCEVIAEALNAFQLKFDAAWEKLCARNGGPPRVGAVLERPEDADAPIDFWR